MEEAHMADPPRSPDTGDHPDVAPDRGSTTGTPRWVKVFGIIAAVLVLLVVIMLLTGGNHGPSRHTGGLSGHPPPSSITDHGAQQR
jgi:hypothetical protein